jgi:hypothetical protein
MPSVFRLSRHHRALLGRDFDLNEPAKGRDLVAARSCIPKK